MKRHLRLARTAIIVACLASLLVGCSRRSAQENQAEIHLYAAQIHLQDKQPKLALTQLELAKELVPDYPKTHLLLGVAYANGGRLEEAFEEYRFVTEREPENEKAWLFWGQALYLSGRFGEAANKLERAAGLEPNSGLILSELGIALSAYGRHDAAVSTLGRMAEVEPDPPTPALLAWGTSLASLGQGAEARKPLEAILAKDPDHLSTLSILGAVLENSDDPSERERAVALHERALRAMPGGGRFSLRATSSGDGTAVFVTDTGGGIPDGVRGRIFDLFFTTRSEGTGVGLATVKKIVERLGGSIHLEPQSGNGTCFLVDLP